MASPDEWLSLLVQDLSESGDLTPAWRDPFLAVPRHLFIPDTVWTDDRDALMPVRKADDREAWLDICYANEFVATQVDDGNPVGPGQVGQEITSSASRPDVVELMLTALEAEPGMTVLEIGTGTGCNAAILAERLGAENVTTIEVDPEVAGHAQRALKDAGYQVTAITADGALGHPAGAPYDRVVATVGVQHVPYAWVEQTRPGGFVLVPWGTTSTTARWFLSWSRFINRPMVQLALHPAYPQLRLDQVGPRRARIHRRPPQFAHMPRTRWSPSPCAGLSPTRSTTAPPSHPGGIGRRRAFPPPGWTPGR